MPITTDRRSHTKLCWIVVAALVFAVSATVFVPWSSVGGAEATAKSAPAYTVPAERQSYFLLDDQGGLVERDGLPVRAEKIYRFQRTIDPAKTAVIVMDPWIDMASEHLNEYYSRIAESRVVPLVNEALKRGHRVLVLTNDPKTVKYNTKIHPQLAALVDEGKATLLYHQDLDDDAFAEYLHKAGINTLVYTGFASNMCVIGRRMGMMPMVQQGFKTYFVPEASAAVETEGTWETGSVHRETTNLIAQWIAEIVHYDDFMQADKE
jgi:nicotinamidase-related amidase